MGVLGFINCRNYESISYCTVIRLYYIRFIQKKLAEWPAALRPLSIYCTFPKFLRTILLDLKIFQGPRSLLLPSLRSHQQWAFLSTSVDILFYPALRTGTVSPPQFLPLSSRICRLYHLRSPFYKDVC